MLAGIPPRGAFGMTLGQGRKGNCQLESVDLDLVIVLIEELILRDREILIRMYMDPALVFEEPLHA